MERLRTQYTSGTFERGQSHGIRLFPGKDRYSLSRRLVLFQDSTTEVNINLNLESKIVKRIPILYFNTINRQLINYVIASVDNVGDIRKRFFLIRTQVHDCSREQINITIKIQTILC